ncbi:ribonuclease HIII [Radiobacillus kanasensis]|uniref:ribonuclease HIII n=1 Tax=Radiobacillus kanasensis TaxID=2844358 RepID=UPI001E36A8F2|nr:ribonuclease HIII [Radiobacillus kanasensis]UFT97980.1 ribonuclease HIII [Radiobacillus kanasensis]
MSHVVLTLTKDKIKDLETYYKSSLKAAPAGAVFAAKTANSSITAYHSGKVLFQGKAAEVEAAKWGSPDTSNKKSSTSKKKPAHAFAPPSSLFTTSHIGSDEAGTGDYFGPITVAAAYVQKEQIPLLKELGVQDSKNLTDEKISQIAKDLVQMKLPYSLVILHNEKYNRVQLNGWSQGKMKTMLHHTAITKLLQKIAPERPTGILIDQFSEPHSYQKHLRSENEKLQENVYFMTKAESYSIAVAAGSIIARASFVKEMDKLSEQLGMTLPKGASQKVDQVAARLLKKYSKQELGNYAKMHFANTQKAMKY